MFLGCILLNERHGIVPRFLKFFWPKIRPSWAVWRSFIQFPGLLPVLYCKKYFVNAFPLPFSCLHGFTIVQNIFWIRNMRLCDRTVCHFFIYYVLTCVFLRVCDVLTHCCSVSYDCSQGHPIRAPCPNQQAPPAQWAPAPLLLVSAGWGGVQGSGVSVLTVCVNLGCALTDPIARFFWWLVYPPI